MKIRYSHIVLIGLINSLLTACTSMSDIGAGANNLISGGSVAVNTNQTYPKNSPDNVHIFFDEKPHKSYIEIGQVNIDTDNMLGIPKSETEIIRAMQEQAASIGGDAVINVNQSMSSAIGTVIVYKGINKRNI